MRRRRSTQVATIPEETVDLDDPREDFVRSSAPSPSLSLVEHIPLHVTDSDWISESNVCMALSPSSISSEISPQSNTTHQFSRTWDIPVRRLSSRSWEADSESTPRVSPLKDMPKKVIKVKAEKLSGGSSKGRSFSYLQGFWIVFLIALAFKGILALCEAKEMWCYSPTTWDGRSPRPRIKVEFRTYRGWVTVPQRGQPGFVE